MKSFKTLAFFILLIIIGVAVWLFQQATATQWEERPFQRVFVEVDRADLVDSNLEPFIKVFDTLELKCSENTNEPIEFNLTFKNENLAQNESRNLLNTSEEVADFNPLVKWTLFSDDKVFKKLTEEPNYWPLIFSELTKVRLRGYRGILIDCSAMPLTYTQIQFFNHLFYAMRSQNLISAVLYTREESHQRMMREADLVMSKRSKFTPTYLWSEKFQFPENALIKSDALDVALAQKDSLKLVDLPRIMTQLKDLTILAEPLSVNELKLAEMMGVSVTSRNHLRLGKMYLDRNTKTLHIPVVINMNSGYAEVVLCNPKGRIHEALMITDITPQDFQLMLILAGYQNWVQNKSDSKRIEGSRMSLQVYVEGSKAPVSVDSWLREYETKKPLTFNDYLFVGSETENGVDMATRDGNLINVNSLDKYTVLLKNLADTDTAQHEAVFELMPSVIYGSFEQPNYSMAEAPKKDPVAKELQLKGMLLIRGIDEK